MSHLIPLSNFIICMAGAWMCLYGRLNKMDFQTTKKPIRWQYFLKLIVFLASGLSFSYDFPANAIQLFMGSLLVIEMMIGGPAWRYGQPDHAKKFGIEPV
jgi:hypothetical protein